MNTNPQSYPQRSDAENTRALKHSYTLVYHRNGEWKTTLIATTDLQEANEERRKLELMGYPTYVKSRYEVLIVGMPEGPAPYWDYENCRPKRS